MIRFSSFRKTAALLFALPALACASPSRSPARSVLSDKLREKLELQWVRYDAAQAELIRQSPAPIPRDRWEALLRLPDWMALTVDDLAELRRDQAERAAAARERARQQSVIDLDAVRASNSAGAFCASFPKGGMLHIHPSGTLKRPTVERLLQQENPRIDSATLIATNRLRLYPDEINYLQGITGNPAFSTLTAPDQARFTGFFLLPPGTHPFTRFDAAFAFIGLVLQSDDAYTSALEDFAKRAASQGVIYVEMTTGIQPADVPAFEEIARRIESRTGVVLRFNRSFNRTRKSQDLIQQAQALLSVRSPVITGIDLLGDETSTPALENGQGPYGVVLKAVREAGSPLHRTMHAGELGDPRDPRDALVLGAERLGHGVKLAEDPVALEYAVCHHVPVEINLVSNLRLRAIDDLGRHPFLNYLRLGLPVSLSTDDEGILETDINTECVTAITRSDVSYAELKEMSYNSIRTSFADEQTRRKLEDRLHAAFDAFERSQGVAPSKVFVQ